MSFVQKNIYYFEKPGPANTTDSAKLAKERAIELGITRVIVASTSGKTAKVFCETLKGSGISLIIVTHVVGFAEPGIWEFSAETASELRKNGVIIITGTHVLSGLEKAFSKSSKVSGGSRTEAVAEALRRVVAVGLKVAVECVMIAADQGEIPVNEEVISIGGTGSGADTVVVIRPAHTSSFFDLQVREIVAMPRNR